MGKCKSFFHGIAYAGCCMVFLFAVCLFEQLIPDKIYVKAGEEISYSFQVPVTVVMKEDSIETAHNQKTDHIRQSYTVTCRLFGIFPVKDVEVMLVDGDAVYAGGNSIGIYVKTKGVLVIGTGEVTLADGTKESPAENIVKPGDYIMSVNGKEVMEKETLQQLIGEDTGMRKVLGIQRNGEYIEVSVAPKIGADGKQMLGIWVRDDLAGIGTLTYYHEDGSFGALGHAVSDGDVGETIQMGKGSIYKANIIGVKKGEKGAPGELSGMIDYHKENYLGTMDKNTEIGIYGKLNGNISDGAMGTYYNICYKQDIEKGAAYILSGLTGEIKQYEIEIESVDYSGKEANKGILFKVTDEELLNLTGGIVQGMSGSPIIQNGKIIGAVTHVFVSEPSMGYGIFIETMLDEDGA